MADSKSKNGRTGKKKVYLYIGLVVGVFGAIVLALGIAQEWFGASLFDNAPVMQGAALVLTGAAFIMMSNKK